MKNTNSLYALGFTSDDSHIYEALVRGDALSVTELASKTKLYRPSVYHALEKLIRLGAVSEVPAGKRKKYKALPPKYLKELFHKQEKVVIQEIMRLEDATVHHSKVPNVIVLKGKQGLTIVYDQMMKEIKKGELYYRYQAIDTDVLDLKKYMSQTARILRNAKELERYVITNEVSKKATNPHHNRLIKVLPDSDSPFKHGIGQIMYGNKTAIIDYHNETATIIESESITEFQKAVFKALFKRL